MVKMPLRNCAAIISITVLLCGCGYKFLSTGKTKIFIYPVTNYSLQPLVDIYLNDALRDVFIEYPEYQLVKNLSDADYALKVNIKKWERSPLFFSGEKSREIVIAKFLVETEIELFKGKKIIFTDAIVDNISTSLGKEYKEEDILTDISKKLALNIYFHIIEKR
ncbi:MAG: hypothetical protein NC905_02310 [Candidatus Omnitrophica bacterium]|nr:hypothetical protein [Candidatus Omnitrophota bacterium]MCM8777083.1 hypothetical protein [Candidatus Omnitrophota bacterium]